MTATVDCKEHGYEILQHQRGVALLQVLLLGAIFSLLAIQFAQTGRNQIDIAEKYENRVRGQIAAHTAINELIFILLSEDFHRLTNSVGDKRLDLTLRPEINFFGDAVDWSNGVTVSVQDMNGVLPLLFPDHFLWEILLETLQLPAGEVKRYIGTWKDMQDHDRSSWLMGEAEPSVLPSGRPYPNAYAQNEKVMEWVFEDRPEIVRELVKFSDIHARFDTNILHLPNELLDALFDRETASAIRTLRSVNVNRLGALRELLPKKFDHPNIATYESSDVKISVEVQVGSSSWQEQRIVRFTPMMKIPFQILVNN